MSKAKKKPKSESKREAYGQKQKRSLWAKAKEKPMGESEREAYG